MFKSKASRSVKKSNEYYDLASKPDDVDSENNVTGVAFASSGATDVATSISLQIPQSQVEVMNDCEECEWVSSMYFSMADS